MTLPAERGATAHHAEPETKPAQLQGGAHAMEQQSIANLYDEELLSVLTLPPGRDARYPKKGAHLA
jgi:hypothetical protein